MSELFLKIANKHQTYVFDFVVAVIIKLLCGSTAAFQYVLLRLVWCSAYPDLYNKYANIPWKRICLNIFTCAWFLLFFFDLLIGLF